MRQAVSRFIIRAGARAPWIVGRPRRVVRPLGVAGLAMVVGVVLAVHSAALPPELQGSKAPPAVATVAKPPPTSVVVATTVAPASPTAAPVSVAPTATPEPVEVGQLPSVGALPAGAFAAPAFAPLPLVGFSGATWIPSPYHRPRRMPIDTLVLHTTAGSLQATIAEFLHSSRHVSAHYVVARDGQITQMVSENQVAFHAGIVTAGPGSRFLGTSPNAYSIGIEIENPSVIHGAAEFPAAQKAAVFKLVKDVVQRNHIPIDREHIVGHSEIDPANRQDPGPGFPWEELLAYVQS